jgi:hypothetical protein
LTSNYELVLESVKDFIDSQCLDEIISSDYLLAPIEHPLDLIANSEFPYFEDVIDPEGPFL